MFVGYCRSRQDKPRKNGYPSSTSVDRFAIKPPVVLNCMNKNLVMGFTRWQNFIRRMYKSRIWVIGYLRYVNKPTLKV